MPGSPPSLYRRSPLRRKSILIPLQLGNEANALEAGLDQHASRSNVLGSVLERVPITVARVDIPLFSTEGPE
jgi:hypothetical protein